MKLALYLTNKCNVDRGFCYDWVGCHPSKNDDIFAAVPAILYAAKNIPAIDTIAFSGGECTLYPNQLLDAIAYAKSLGFTVQLKTNGWWGAQAETVVKGLYDAGLDYLRISYDSKWFYAGSPITKANLRRAIAVAFVAFKDRRFAVVTTANEPDLASLQNTKVNGEQFTVEPTPAFNSNYRIEEDWTGFDPVVGAVTTTHLKFKGFRPTIDYLKRVFINTLGLAELEKGGVQGTYYVGDLNKDTLQTLYDKFKTMAANA